MEERQCVCLRGWVSKTRVCVCTHLCVFVCVFVRLYEKEKGREGKLFPTRLYVRKTRVREKKDCPICCTRERLMFEKAI